MLPDGGCECDLERPAAKEAAGASWSQRNETEVAAHLSHIFSEIARQITASEGRIRPGQGELREGAGLLADLEGLTHLTQGLSPNEVMGLLTEYQARLVPVLRTHGGSVDRFPGDAILATFRS